MKTQQILKLTGSQTKLAEMAARLLLSIVLLLSSGLVMAQENCGNGVDDDGDGYVDAYDIDCGCDPSTEAFPSDDIWLFGNNAGLDFSAGFPIEITGNPMTTNEASATAVDALGNLQFFTNGENVWNSSNTIMPNGTGLAGHNSSNSGVLTFPVPGNEFLHYVIAADYGNGATAIADSVTYSIVDMRGDGGNGDVTTKNVLISGASEGLAVIPHISNGNYWVLSLDQNTNTIYNTEFTASGPGSFLSLAFAYTISERSKIASSPAMDRIAITNYDGNEFALFDFNRSNGFISNIVIIPHGDFVYDASFSHDGNYLYVTTLGGTVSQYNVGGLYNTATIQASRFDLVSNATSYGGLNRGADGRIYVTQANSALSAIANPNLAGAAAGWVDSSFVFTAPGAVPTLGIPNVAPTCFRPPALYALLDSISVAEDDNLSGASFLGNDYAYLGNFDTTSIQILSLPTNGSFFYSPGTATFNYAPTADYFGTDSLEYRVCDIYGNCDTSWARFYITSVNDNPIAVADTGVALEDTPILMGLVGNDTDADGTIDISSVTILTAPMLGSAVPDATGNITYTPSADLNGVDSFEYSVADNEGGVGSIWSYVTITPVNDPPTAVNDVLVGLEDTPMTTGLLGNDSDIDGSIDVSSISILTAPLNGSVSVDVLGDVTYTPDLDYNGIDSFNYRVADDSAATATAWVILTINPDNDAPIAVDDIELGIEDTPLIMSPLDNDSDSDGALDTASISITSAVSHGLLSIDAVNGTITYTPDLDYNGLDSMSYQICDDGGLCATAIIRITVTPGNDPPMAVNDVGFGIEDTPLIMAPLSNDSDVDGTLDTASLQIMTGPYNGVATIDFVNATVNYTPALNFNGVDSATYQICDDAGDCATAKFTWNVSPVNDAPIVTDDAVLVQEDTPIIWAVLDNDSDVENGIDTASLTIISGPFYGAATADAFGNINYTPTADYFGPDSATYEICDADGDCSQAMVRWTVRPLNDIPIANADIISVFEDTPIIIGVLDNDSDIDGTFDYTSLAILTPAGNGFVSVSFTDGTVNYVPFSNFYGADSLEYSICDDSSACASNWVYITVDPVNDPPQVNDDFAISDAGIPVAIDVVANDNDDFDPMGGIDPTTLVITGDPSNGTVAFSAGIYIYQPNSSFYGLDSFTYQLCDIGFPLPSLCGEATVVIDVNGSAPLGAIDVASTDQGIPVVIDVLANDGANASPLCVGLVTDPSSGTATVNPDGTITYTSFEDFIGTDCFTYRFCDLAGNESEAVSVCVEVGELFDVTVPIVFTPNGDGINDQLYIDGLENYVDNEIYVYDRTGKLVYEQNLYQNNWEGKDIRSGNPVSDGTYFYFLNLRTPSGKQDTKRGHTTIAR